VVSLVLRILSIFAAILALQGPVAAQTVAEATDAGDIEDVISAYRLMIANDYEAAGEEVAGMGSLGADLILWQKLRNFDGEFAEYGAFFETHPEWPDLDRLHARGERQIDAETPGAAVLAYFDGRVPVSGNGALAYAAALQEAGRGEEADALLVAFWQTEGLSEQSHARFLAVHEELLGPHHVARIEMLLWRGRSTDAGRLVSRLEGADKALAEARLGLMREAGNVDTLIAAVPEARADDPGLAYARFNWRIEKNQTDDAIALLLERSTSVETLGEPLRWSGWRRSLARREMREGDATRAYQMASQHFMTEGTNYNDLEWLSGYIALRKLDDPELALGHFETFDGAVETPISKGRAGYWLGMTHRALGNEEAARAAFEAAALHQTGFYGLLAAQELGLPLDPSLTGREDFGDWRNAAWMQSDVTRAGILLVLAGQRSEAEEFFAHLSNGMERAELGQLAHLLSDLGAAHIAVRVAKQAVLRDIVLPEIYFPLHPLAELEMQIEPALALAIARRESEFDPAVASGVGAQGLMQLMPATAREVSGKLNLPYARGRLISDPGYNARLGITYLEELQERLGPTPAMIAAGYNAGPSRPLTWSDNFGDPRIGTVDVVDWIEHIPFRETRNYVMRVTESLPVYRARLSGEVPVIDFRALLVGTKPMIRPRVRPSAEPVVIEALPEPEEIAPVRPRVRPVVAEVEPAAEITIRRGTTVTRGPVGPSGPATITGARPIVRPGAPATE
jgi:soluble lytic murein transglycosylase